MAKIEIIGIGTFNIREKTSLLRFLQDKHLPVNAQCGGLGNCGQCRIKVESKPRRPRAIDKKLISKKLLKQGYRLACQYFVTEDMKISISKSIPQNADLSTGKIGLALDLGTTVIKGALVDLKRKQVLKIAKIHNPQNSLGGDVMTRIALTLRGQYKTLRSLLFQGIGNLKKILGVACPNFTAVTGNPVMLSFYLGKSVRGLASYPYQSGIEKGFFQTKTKQYIFGSIGGFVGGDTIAGIMASGIMENKNISLYIDLGTNGEVALITKKKILAVSAAAGPAFEGVGLKCGSLAMLGAIDRIEYNNGFHSHTIGGLRPKGICASGLIDLLAALIEMGGLNEKGTLLKPIRIAGIQILQSDIRKLQLAIGAIHTGVQFLIERAGIKPSEISQTIITGEFGSHLSAKSLVRIGIIPKGIRRIRFENDLPLQGAIMALIDDNVCEQAAIIEKKSEHLELATQSTFQEKFVAALRLGPWS